MFKLTKSSEINYILKLNDYNEDVSEHLYDSIQRIMPLSRRDTLSNELMFTAEHVDYLHNYKETITYSQIIKMIDCISKQLNYMNSVGYGCIGFSQEDILIINDKYIICNPKLFLPLHNNYMFIVEPMKMPQFVSLKLTKLPTKIYYTSSYYSLGALVVFCLLHKTIDGNVDTIIEPLTNTKIFWFLKRSLHDDPHKRTLLLI